jgi:hypothetical protein
VFAVRNRGDKTIRMLAHDREAFWLCQRTHYDDHDFERDPEVEATLIVWRGSTPFSDQRVTVLERSRMFLSR